MMRLVYMMSAAGMVLSLAAGVAAPALAGEGSVGVNYSILTSPFWTAYDRYIQKYSQELGVPILAPINSQQDLAKQITDVQNLINLGAGALIVSPVDSASIQPSLNQAGQKGIPVVTVDVAPTRARSRSSCAPTIAYGEKACQYIGEHVHGGQGRADHGRPGVDQRPRSRQRLPRLHHRQLPELRLLEIPTKAWQARVRPPASTAVLTANPDLKAIYMHAGGVFLAPTLQTLKRKGLLKLPAGEPGHIIIVSNDGIPQEFDAIRKGEADATVSQPADLYAKYGLHVPEGGDGGEERSRPGPTDHDSNIVEVAPGVLEDQLAAPLVTKENVDDKGLWGNKL